MDNNKTLVYGYFGLGYDDDGIMSLADWGFFYSACLCENLAQRDIVRIVQLNFCESVNSIPQLQAVVRTRGEGKYLLLKILAYQEKQFFAKYQAMADRIAGREPQRKTFAK